jgi:hypothetical protein
MESPRRYPRTLQEAFGPHTSRHVHVDAPRASLRAWAVYLAVLALAITGAMLAGCTRAEAKQGFGDSWGLVDKTSVDEHGVVCYSKNGQTLSCVKVK